MQEEVSDRTSTGVHLVPHDFSASCRAAALCNKQTLACRAGKEGADSVSVLVCYVLTSCFWLIQLQAC